VALVICRDCGQKVSDSAASCPGCGAIRRAYNELNWPGFHVAAAAFVISVAAISLPASANFLTRITTIGLSGLLVAILCWVAPYIVESRKLSKQDRMRTKYTPGAARGSKQFDD